MTFKEFYNYKKYTLQELLEGSGFTIQDLKKNAPSKRNKKFLKIRQEEGRTGSFLEDVLWDEKGDYLRLFFEIVPTYIDTEKEVKVVDLKGNVKEGATFYTVLIQFEDVNKHLGKIKDFLQLKPKEQIQLMDLMIKQATVKIYSDDMSYYWQGLADNADKLGFSVFPFPKNKSRGKGIWSYRHKSEYPAIYLTKHLMEVLSVIPFISADIAKRIREKY